MLKDMLNNLLGNLGLNKNGNSRSSKTFGFSRSRTSLNYKLITYEQARPMIENLEVVLIDVRSKAEYDIMHVKNAINIPVSEIEKEIFTYEQSKGIMVYCTTGTRSKNAIQILNNLGYINIYIWEYAALANFPYKDMLIYNK